MIRMVLVLAAVVAIAVAANVALLSLAAGSHERVGQLSPVLAGSPSSTPSVAGPSTSSPHGPTVPKRADESEAEDDADD